jgi:hypothetical protein
MITKQDYMSMLELDRGLIGTQIEGITDAQSLLQPANGGNSLRWVLGHLTENLVEILRLLGVEPVPEVTALERFVRTSEPIKGDEPGLLRMEEIMQIYDQLEPQIVEKLQQMNEDDFDLEIGPGERKARLGWKLYFYGFHHHYHIGQLEYLRNLAGLIEPLI